jgi:hypothetical protein
MKGTIKKKKKKNTLSSKKDHRMSLLTNEYSTIINFSYHINNRKTRKKKLIVLFLRGVL